MIPRLALPLALLAAPAASAAPYVVSLPYTPPTTVRCTLSSPTGETIQVQFDPAVDGVLSRRVELDPNDGWTLSCRSDPQLVTLDKRQYDTSWGFLGKRGDWNTSAGLDHVRLGVRERTQVGGDKAEFIPSMEYYFDKGERVGAAADAMAPAAFRSDFADHLVAQGLLKANRSTWQGLQADRAAVFERLRRLDSEMATLPAVQIRNGTMPTLADESKNLGITRGGALGSRSLSSPAPELVTDTLALLAEIALERGKNRSTAFLVDRFAMLICEDLSPKGLGLAVPGFAPTDTLLPKTCGAIKGQTLEGLAASGEELGKALEGDLVGLALNLAQSRVPDDEAGNVAFIMKTLTPTLLDLTVRDQKLTGPEAQALLVALANHDWGVPNTVPTDDAAEDYLAACHVQLGLAAAASCHAAGSSCDARMVGDLLSNPSSHFTLGTVCDGVLDVENQWPELPRLVQRALDIVTPPRGSKPVDQARATLDVMFGISEKVVTSNEPDEETKRRATQLLDEVHQLSIAVLERDVADASTSGLATIRAILELERRKAACPVEGKAAANEALCRQVEKGLASLERFVPLLTVLEANTRDLEAATLKPEDAEKLREARKKRLVDLIDAATRRDQRGGDVVVSLGTPVGYYMGASLTQSTLGLTTGQLEHRLGLPMGVAVQLLPGNGKRLSGKGPSALRKFGFGWHGQLSVVDLGQFLSSDELELGNVGTAPTSPPTKWNEFVIVGAQGGMLLGTPKDAFVIGVDLRHVPASNTTQLGAFATYYVPFFDLN